VAAALGLATRRGAAWKKHARPRAEARSSGASCAAAPTAAIDLSDGLSLDLHRLSARLGRLGRARRKLSRFFPGASLDQAAARRRGLRTACFTARAEVEGAIRIGAIRKGRPGRVIFQGKTLAPMGYDHFPERGP